MSESTKRPLSFYRWMSIFLALICIVLIPVWILGVAPQILQIPDTFTYRADMTSADNFYDAIAHEYNGQKYSRTEFSYQVVEKHEDVLVIQNTFRVYSLDGKTIYDAKPHYGIDALTGAHVPGFGDKDRDGYLFAPRGVKEGDSFAFWHPSSNVPAEMVYQGVEYLYGLRVLKFSSNYGGAIDQTDALGFLPDVGETKGIRLEQTVTIWVEPTTGYLVNEEDYSTDYYYYDLQTGVRLAPYNQFSNAFTEESIQRHANVAMGMRNIAYLVLYGVPILLALFAVLCLLYLADVLPFVRRLSRMRVVSFGTLALMILVSAGTYAFVQFSVTRRLSEELNADAVDVEQKITKQIELYTGLLYGGRALFDASESVSRAEWKAYVQSLRLPERYPNMLAISYAPFVSAEKKAEYIQAIRDEGFSAFDIFPTGEREAYTPVDYIEPDGAVNLRAFGFDMFSEDTRRYAMTRARDTDAVSATTHIRLVQTETNSERIGFLLYVPVFSHDVVSSGTEKALQGYVASGFYIDAIMEGVGRGLSSEMGFRVYDDARATPDRLVFSSVADSGDLENERGTFFNKTITVFIGETPWTVRFFNAPGYQGSVIDRVLPPLSLGLGLLVGALVFGILLSLGRSKERATELARTLTKDLAEEERVLEEQNALLEEKLVELDRTNKAMIDRESRMIELKEQLKKYETHSR